MAGVSCLFHNASHYRESRSDSANWLRKREDLERVLCNNHRSVFINDLGERLGMVPMGLLCAHGILS